MCVEGDISTAHAFPAESRLHLLYRRSPPLWHKFLCILAPHVLINMYAISIPAYPGMFGDGYLSTKESGLRGDAINELGNRGIEAKEFVDDGCQDREAV